MKTELRKKSHIDVRIECHLTRASARCSSTRGSCHRRRRHRRRSQSWSSSSLHHRRSSSGSRRGRCRRRSAGASSGGRGRGSGSGRCGKKKIHHHLYPTQLPYVQVYQCLPVCHLLCLNFAAGV